MHVRIRFVDADYSFQRGVRPLLMRFEHTLRHFQQVAGEVVA